MDLNGKNIIYIGGFGGIGQKCVEEMLKKSVKNLIIFDVILNEVFLKYLQNTYGNSTVEFIQVNLIEQQSITKAFNLAKERFGHFDVVFNGSGTVNENNVELTIATNMIGVINSTLIALQHMDKSKGGKGGLIATISSVLGIEPNPIAPVYSATKCGVIGFNRAISHPEFYSKTGVSFITICPGFTLTPLLEGTNSKLTEYSLPFLSLMDIANKQTPLECAENIMKILNKASNGSIWILDGGNVEEIKYPVLWKVVNRIPVGGQIAVYCFLFVFNHKYRNMSFALKCKNVIYLGGFGGIGQKCVEEFLKKGVQNLVVFDLKENSDVMKKWQDTYKSSNIYFQPVDVTKSETIEEAYKQSKQKLDYIDVVLNGCGLMDDRYLDLTIDINLRGVLHSSMIALGYMDKSKGGRGGVIANISSVAGIEASGMFAIYSAAKHGVTAFSRAMSNPLYFKNTGVNFVTICPGLTETPLLDNVKDKVTLIEYGQPMAEKFVTLQTQSAQVCSENIIKAIETNKLASVWLLDRGEMSEIEMPVLWKAQ
ncbi:uncharacterized protein LOC142236015 [Haematobia irritans]|uniref:uncharacterized protein LOC142236015 n=1 Tax=Haematobia irritans TaxID=7368 RepID=UPI003F4F6B51